MKRKRRLVVNIGVVLATFGPGLISANAGNDAGGILTYASAGAQFGYRTLFLMVVVTVGLVVVQEMSSRLGVYTGQGLGGLIREQFSAPSTFAAMLMLLIANAGLTVSEFASIGAAMGILGVSRYLSIPVAAVLVWITTVLGSYSKAERLFLVLARLPRVPGRRRTRPPEWSAGAGQSGLAALSLIAQLPRARRGPHRDHDHPVYAVLRGVRGRRQRSAAEGLQEGAVRHGQRGRSGAIS